MLWLIPLLVLEMVALVVAFKMDASELAPPAAPPPVEDYAPPSPPASPPSSPAQPRRGPPEPRARAPDAGSGGASPRVDSARSAMVQSRGLKLSAAQAAPLDVHSDQEGDGAPPLTQRGCLTSARLHMLCPRPSRFRRTWWVKCVFSSFVVQELVVASYLAIHTETPLPSFPTGAVLGAALVSCAFGLLVQAICAFAFIQCGRYTDILGARLIERRYLDELDDEAEEESQSVSWAPYSDHPDFSESSAASQSMRSRRDIARSPIGSPRRENPFMGYRSNYGYGAAYDSRQRCGVATPAGLASTPTALSFGPNLPRQRPALPGLPSPPPSPSAADDEAGALLAPTLTELEISDGVSVQDPPVAELHPRGVMALCWACQLALALAILMAACWVSVTRRTWQSHAGPLMASLFTGFVLRIVVFEPALMQLLPSWAGRVLAENALGTHNWEYRAPVRDQPKTTAPLLAARTSFASAHSSSRKSGGDRRVLVVRPGGQRPAATPEEAEVDEEEARPAPGSANNPIMSM